MAESMGARLKRLRASHELTQEQVAARLNVSRYEISYYENDVRQLSIDSLIRLSQLYHVTTDYLLGIQKRQQMIDATGLTEKEWKLLSEFVSEISRRNLDM